MRIRTWALKRKLLTLFSKRIDFFLFFFIFLNQGVCIKLPRSPREKKAGGYTAQAPETIINDQNFLGLCLCAAQCDWLQSKTSLKLVIQGMDPDIIAEERIDSELLLRCFDIDYLNDNDVADTFGFMWSSPFFFFMFLSCRAALSSSVLCTHVRTFTQLCLISFFPLHIPHLPCRFVKPCCSSHSLS